MAHPDDIALAVYNARYGKSVVHFFTGVNYRWVREGTAIALAESNGSNADIWQNTNCTMSNGQPARPKGKPLQEQADIMYSVWKRTHTFFACWGTARPGSRRYYRKAEFWNPAGTAVKHLQDKLSSPTGISTHHLLPNVGCDNCHHQFNYHLGCFCLDTVFGGAKIAAGGTLLLVGGLATIYILSREVPGAVAAKTAAQHVIPRGPYKVIRKQIRRSPGPSPASARAEETMAIRRRTEARREQLHSERAPREAILAYHSERAAEQRAKARTAEVTAAHRARLYRQKTGQQFRRPRTSPRVGEKVR